MKIVTWNCNLNLEKKFDLLQSLTPDIAIIQECEKLKENHFSNCKYFWCGENEKKRSRNLNAKFITGFFK